MEYKEFLASKFIKVAPAGKVFQETDINPVLFQFQRDIVLWACRKGRAAIFADTGLGKTFMQIEWARLMGSRSLIIAPLSVARQTANEARKIGVSVNYTRSSDGVKDGINITNYEMLDHFDASVFDAVVLDESSILKSLDGKTRRKLVEMFSDTPYRLCCTATPAPNDQSEIGNHAEFLGIATMVEMLAMFFIHANKVEETVVYNGQLLRTKKGNDKGQEWRIKHHGKDKFYRWMASWSVSIRTPSDLGYSDDGYILPPLTITPEFVDTDYKPDNQLFFTGLSGITDRTNVRRATLADRVKKAVEIIDSSDEQWIVWCGLNQESKAIVAELHDAVEIEGSESPERKIEKIENFQDGKYKVMVTKPAIAGFGMNFQNSHNALFLGLNDSWETYYQCIRRQYRFGQSNPVNVYIVLSEVEREIYDNIVRKEEVSKRMSAELIKNIQVFEKEEIEGMEHAKFDYKEDTIKSEHFTAMLGDSAQRLQEIEDNSIDLSVYSPPFADLYTYSATEHDLGNSRNWPEFFAHYSFIIKQMLRITKPGRLTCVHTSDIPAMAVKDGYIGMKDFPGEVIRAYENDGWVFVGRAIVAKNPQAQAIRTKAKALLFTQLRKDSSDSRPAILDQILLFKKPGENETPIRPVDNGEMNNETWIDWAGGIWLGIQESDTLQYTTARDDNDEKHICPLQLGTIERCIKLYSNPGETVLTPFMGIGSEAYQAVKFGRKAIGIELKESYYAIAVKNLKEAEMQRRNKGLFFGMEFGV